MSLNHAGIVHKCLGETMVAIKRRPFANRRELHAIVDEVAQALPAGVIAGPAFCIFQFVTSLREGFYGDVGFPVCQAVNAGGITSRPLPAMEVLSLVHHGPVERLRETVKTLFGEAYARGLVSDECLREVYLDADSPEGNEIEVQFVLHDWLGLLDRHTRRVLGEARANDVLQGCAGVPLDVPAEERFYRVKDALERLEGVAKREQVYDALSSCAHVFPAEQVDKLRRSYEDARAAGKDPLAAVDAVLDFMGGDPGWGERPRREGRTVFSSKKPRDPQAWEAATSPAEKAQAYCFCPIIRSHLAEGMPVDFCYCGAGWYRRQWEGAISRPVQIDIVESLLQGDERCTFAIHLPEDW